MPTVPSQASSPPRAGAVLSSAQKRLWFLDRLGAGAALNIPLALRLRGPLQAAALEEALNEIARRHGTLRTSFAADGGRPTARLAARPDVRLFLRDLRSLPAAGREELAERLAREEFARPFDLSVAPLLRATLLQLADDEHVLVLTLHHAVSDSWSMGRLLGELGQLLDASARGQASPLPELSVQYADFAERQARELDAGSLDRARNYWRRQLEGLGPLDLPTDRPRPAELSWAGGSSGFTLEADVSVALRDLARRRGVSLATVLLAAWQALLARLSGQEDVAVGAPVSHRPRVELEPLIGVFTNSLVLRTDLSGDPGFADELLPRVQDVLFGALAHQDMPFEQLVADLNPPRDLSRHPLFQLQFSLSVASESRRLGELQCEPLRWQSAATGLDLDLRFAEQDGVLSGRLIHHADLFDDATARRMVSRLVRILAGVTQHPQARLSQLPLLDAEERALVVHGWNDTAAALPEQTLAGLLAERAARAPQAVAFVHGEQALTRGELLSRAARLARQLQVRGVRRGDLVGVLADRGMPLVVALLGVLQAGAAYVPLDPALPDARLAFMLQDAGVAILLTSTRRALDFAGPGVRALALDADGTLSSQAATAPAMHGWAAPPSDPDDLAYVIYTSGSTGRPKGVAVTQRGVINLLLGMAREPGLAADDVLLALTSVSFDIAVVELFLPLVTGARAVIADERHTTDGRALAALIDDVSVTVLQATPTTFRLLLGSGWRGGSRLRLLCGAETLTRELADELLPRCGELWNLYGPTEASVWALAARVTEGGGPVPIGRPLPNMQAFVLDAQDQPQPVGVVGELCLGGVGLARGYWRRPELTAQAFVRNPLREGERMYRTGDRARFLPDGSVEFHGRRDRQVKLRSYRIELGEIERVLSRHPAVAECAVVLREDPRHGAHLVAHVVARPNATAHVDELRASLQAELPAFMVPARFVAHAALPRTPGQKLDLARLATLDAPATGHEARGRPPSTPTEIWLADLWRRLLGVQVVGLSDNFFDLGGHSLLAMEALHAIERQRGVTLEPRDLLVGNLGQLAAACEGRHARAAPARRGALGRVLRQLLLRPKRGTPHA